MKKNILLLLLLFFVTFSFAQESNKQLNKKTNKVAAATSPTQEIKKQEVNKNTNINPFEKEIVKNNLNNDVLSSSHYLERQQLINKYGNGAYLNIGWYAGVVEAADFLALMERYLPLSNYLTKKTKMLTIIITDKLDRDITQDAANNELDIVYTSAIYGSSLIEKGWIPLVGRRDPVNGVILSLANTTIKENKDLIGKKIFGAYGGTTTYSVKYSLKNAGLLDKMHYIETRTDQNQLLQTLNTGIIDGIIVRDLVAERMIKQNPNKYKIVFKGQDGLGHMLFANPKLNKEKTDLFVKAIMELTPDIEEYKEILKGLDGYRETDKQPFIARKADDLMVPKQVYAVITQLPVKTELIFKK